MVNTLIGQKIDQSQNFLENGMRIPVTEIAVLQNVVLQVKTLEKDNYQAIQLGVGFKKKPKNAYLGHAKKAGQDKAPLKIREVSHEDDAPAVGEFIKVDAVFKPGDIVQVTGTSKGKGFAGVVKRHNFSGGPKTHGQSDRHRAPGSIGQGTTPGRVYKGKRMAGRMGSDTVTVRSLVVVDVDAENNKLFISGLVPGHKNSWLTVTRTGEDKKFVPLLVTDVPDEVKVEDVEETVTEDIKTEEAVAESATDEKTEDVATEEVASTDNSVEEPSKEIEADVEKTSESKEENA